MREFEAKEAAAGLEHTTGFVQRPLNVGDITDAERDDVSVDAGVRQGQLHGIAHRPRNLVLIFVRLGRLVAPGHDHGFVIVDDADLGVTGFKATGHAARLGGPGQLGQTARNIAGTTGHVDDDFARLRIEARAGGVLPHAVDADGHDIVHQVVVGGDVLEDIVDHRHLFAGIDVAKAERRGLLGAVLGGGFGHGQ